MKRCAWTLVIAFALAACFLAGTVVYMRGQRDGLALTTRVLAGDISAAEGIELSLRTAFEGHLVFDTELDVYGGGQSTESEWSTETVPLYPPRRLERNSGLMLGRWGFGLLNLDLNVLRYMHPAERAIYDDFERQAKAAPGLSAEGRVLLNDYTDTLPLVLSAGGDVDIKGEDSFYVPGDAYFPVPLPGEVWADVSICLREENDYFELSAPQLDDITCIYSSAAGEDEVYLAAQMSLDGELLDGSLLPGGRWGVWRIPCTEGDDGGLAADPGAAESVFTLAEPVQDMALYLSRGGEELMLFTLEDGELILTAIDTATGASRRNTIMETARLSFSDAFQGDGWGVYVSGDNRAALLTGADGAYELAAEYDLSGLPLLNPWEGTGVDVNVSDYHSKYYAFDGERLAVLEGVSYVPDTLEDRERMDMRFSMGALRLSVYGPDGALLCCLWIESPLYNGPEYWNSVADVQFREVGAQ